jgi:hypothetical protein
VRFFAFAVVGLERPFHNANISILPLCQIIKT